MNWSYSFLRKELEFPYSSKLLMFIEEGNTAEKELLAKYCFIHNNQLLLKRLSLPGEMFDFLTKNKFSFTNTGQDYLPLFFLIQGRRSFLELFVPSIELNNPHLVWISFLME